ncbi:hypothetical protein [Streptomyces sp. NRRL S-1521]|uniref:hypothetical protein n=1 Tax=Streptomyces sp. NRRL S-1521 TaxID=1609100 RepID=UPI0007496BC1|nr:hypothetical protein [Streptomyces sp. NRRL S-1521]KUL60459.1 hypothetical protein ADL30_08070 [Streptomyces sp. NRRL S-1521]
MAGLVAVLAVAGCGGDGGGGGKKHRGSSSSGGSDGSGSSGGDGSAGGSGSGSGSGSGAKGGSVEGSWVTTADGRPLALVIHERSATLVGENVLCDGAAGPRTIDLSCPKGDSGRTKGRVVSVDARTLKVSWGGAGTDEFLKTEGGKLPEGLPTGVPSGMPSQG